LHPWQRLVFSLDELFRKMNNLSNAPERDGKDVPVDADDSGDEDVFHDAHFPAEEEAVRRDGNLRPELHTDYNIIFDRNF
jgi:hypothetical protein